VVGGEFGTATVVTLRLSGALIGTGGFSPGIACHPRPAWRTLSARWVVGADADA